MKKEKLKLFTVKDLIDKLLTMDQDAIVITTKIIDTDGECMPLIPESIGCSYTTYTKSHLKGNRDIFDEGIFEEPTTVKELEDKLFGLVRDKSLLGDKDEILSSDEQEELEWYRSKEYLRMIKDCETRLNNIKNNGIKVVLI